jgi:hypothetical protein
MASRDEARASGMRAVISGTGVIASFALIPGGTAPRNGVVSAPVSARRATSALSDAITARVGIVGIGGIVSDRSGDRPAAGDDIAERDGESDA